MKAKPHIYVALPAIDELNSLPETIKCLLQQEYPDYYIYIIVNQPDKWWCDLVKVEICRNNSETLEWLKSLNNEKLRIIDKSSRGRGWSEKKGGVGFARKTVMDIIAGDADDNDIIVSLDSDTVFSKNYFSDIIDLFLKKPEIVGLSVPYYHNLTGNEPVDRAILRYEIYMRHYSLNLWRIGSPFNFTALGSAMAFPVWVYKAVGGLSPKKGGEDFYFLQKLRNYGELALTLSEKVYPAARFSDRVDFGTGPALIKGAAGDWDSYPVYDYRLFDEVKETYNLFFQLYKYDVETPMSSFLKGFSGNESIWQRLRKNNPDEKRFIKACHEKINALKVLQYLKFRQNQILKNDETSLIEFIEEFFGDEKLFLADDLCLFSFKNSSLESLNKIRNFMVLKEERLQNGSMKVINGRYSYVV